MIKRMDPRLLIPWTAGSSALSGVVPESISIDDLTDTTGGYDLGELYGAGGVAPYTFAIVGGADQLKFTLTGAGSDILTLTDGVLDQPTKDSYVVDVQVTDADLDTATTTITVTVSPVSPDTPVVSDVTGGVDDAVVTYDTASTFADVTLHQMATSANGPWFEVSPNGDNVSTDTVTGLLGSGYTHHRMRRQADRYAPPTMSGWSNVSTFALQPPGAVADLAGTVPTSSLEVTLDWTNPDSDADTYVIERQFSGDPVWVASAPQPDAGAGPGQFVDTILPPQLGDWYYRQKRTNANGDSDWSNIATITLVAPPVPTVTNRQGTGQTEGTITYT